MIFWAKDDYQTPAWMDDYTTDELETWMYDYIEKIGEHYDGADLPYIDVLNEFIGDGDDDYHESPFLYIDDFACKAFTKAREVFPNSMLIYNDYNFESAQGWQLTKSDKVYTFIEGLVNAGCPIDVVGF